MTTITILPEKNNSYRAVAGDKESTGRTAGEALDALAAQLEDEESGTLVIVQNHRADRFFNVAQQERLTELMQLRKVVNLSPEEESELESLVEAELDGAQRRVEQMWRAGKEALSSEVNFTTSKILMLTYIGRSPEQIAKTLKVDVTVVKQELAKIRAKMR